MPLGHWVQEAFDLARNPYDKLGHLFQGFVPAMAARELLVRHRADYPLPPVYIMENGAAFPDRMVGGAVDDADRVHYLHAHISAVAEAMARETQLLFDYLVRDLGPDPQMVLRLAQVITGPFASTSPLAVRHTFIWSSASAKPSSRSAACAPSP